MISQMQLYSEDDSTQTKNNVKDYQNKSQHFIYVQQNQQESKDQELNHKDSHKYGQQVQIIKVEPENKKGFFDETLITQRQEQQKNLTVQQTQRKMNEKHYQEHQNREILIKEQPEFDIKLNQQIIEKNNHKDSASKNEKNNQLPIDRNSRRKHLQKRNHGSSAKNQGKKYIQKDFMRNVAPNVFTNDENQRSHDCIQIDERHRQINKVIDDDEFNNLQDAYSYGVKAIKDLAYKPITNSYIAFGLAREKQCCLNYCNPEFLLETESRGTKMMMCSKKQAFSMNSVYKIYLCQNEMVRYNKDLLIGEINGNFLGTEFNIYRYLPNKQKVLCATVTYTVQCACNSFKNINLYMPNHAKNKNQFQQCQRLYGKVQNYKELYFDRHTPEGQVTRLVTKQPVWKPHLNKYTLNFKGKAKCASTKNTILVDESGKGQNSFLFCKESKGRFYCEMGSPLSPLVGMGLILTMFDFKLISS